MTLDLLAPDMVWTRNGEPLPEALGRVTHLGIGAHADDLEIMAWPGIVEARSDPAGGFGGLTCTDGAGSPRSGPYAGVDPNRLVEIRRAEQVEAAQRAGYACMVQPGLTSAAVRSPGRGGLADLVREVVAATRARVIYTHNPLDRHPTHRAVCAAVVAGLAGLPLDRRPARVLGCEVWRGLDWLPSNRVVRLDASGEPELAREVIGLFRSQTESGKRYVEAALGRWQERATFGDAHAVDDHPAVVLAVDLSSVVHGGQSLHDLAEDLLDAAAGTIRREIRDLIED